MFSKISSVFADGYFGFFLLHFICLHSGCTHVFHLYPISPHLCLISSSFPCACPSLCPSRVSVCVDFNLIFVRIYWSVFWALWIYLEVCLIPVSFLLFNSLYLNLECFCYKHQSNKQQHIWQDDLLEKQDQKIFCNWQEISKVSSGKHAEMMA